MRKVHKNSIRWTGSIDYLGMDSEAADIIEQYDQIYANSNTSLMPKEIAELTDEELEKTLKRAHL